MKIKALDADHKIWGSMTDDVYDWRFRGSSEVVKFQLASAMLLRLSHRSIFQKETNFRFTSKLSFVMAILNTIKNELSEIKRTINRSKTQNIKEFEIF